MEALLRYDQVDISFGGKPVVQDISFTLHKGEILGLVGESGSGKSTIIKAAMGLLGKNGLVTRGDIRFDGYNIPDLSEAQLRHIRGGKISMIFPFSPPIVVPAQVHNIENSAILYSPQKGFAFP